MKRLRLLASAAVLSLSGIAAAHAQSSSYVPGTTVPPAVTCGGSQGVITQGLSINPPTNTTTPVPCNMSGEYISTADALVAAGTNQATALVLTARNNVVSTAAAGTGVSLPAVTIGASGGSYRVRNNGANALLVYAPPTYSGITPTIDSNAATAGVSVGAGTTGTFVFLPSGNWRQF